MQDRESVKQILLLFNAARFTRMLNFRYEYLYFHISRDLSNIFSESDLINPEEQVEEFQVKNIKQFCHPSTCEAFYRELFLR